VLGGELALIITCAAAVPMCLCATLLQVDNTTFATVLELCEGGDLEAHLQQHHVSTCGTGLFQIRVLVSLLITSD
jgi:hypothetical protein